MSIPDHVRALLHPARSTTKIALVGASGHRHKFGNIILLDLIRRGFTVYPVNPKGGAVAGLTVHPDLYGVPGTVDIVNFVIPPEHGLEVVSTLDPDRFPILWFQPGAGSSALRAATRSFPTVISGPCIMVEAD